MIACLKHLFCASILLFFHLSFVFLDFLSPKHTTYFLSHNHYGFESSFQTVLERLQKDIFGRFNLFGFSEHINPNVIGCEKKAHTQGPSCNFIDFELYFLLFFVQLDGFDKFIYKRLLKSRCLAFFVLVMKFWPMIL